MVAVNKRRTIGKRRKREGKTNYRRRLSLLKSAKLRVVVRRSLNNIVAQMIRYEPAGDKVLITASAQELKKYSWPFRKNIPSAYLVGLLLAQKCKQKKIDEESVLDIGFFTPISGSRLFAVAKGCVDGGMNLRHSADIFPPDDRINGSHIARFAKESKNKNQFSGLRSSKVDVEKIQELFEKAKTTIMDTVK